MAGPYFVATGQPPCANGTSYISRCSSEVGNPNYLGYLSPTASLVPTYIYCPHVFVARQIRHSIDRTNTSRYRPSTTGLLYISDTIWLLQTSNNQQSLRPRLLCQTISPRRMLYSATRG
jgi:hypothetical protein